MAIRKSQSATSSRSSRATSAARSKAKMRLRNLLLENLEQRQLLAVGPQLIGIQPNNSDLIIEGSVRNESPRELTFRFDDSQLIHPSTLDGIRITRSGGDGSFGLASLATDFGTAGNVDIQLTSTTSGQFPTVAVSKANLGAGAAPTITAAGQTLNITLNSNASTPTTAEQLVSAINGSAAALPLVRAKINGGDGTANLGATTPADYSPLQLSNTGDLVIEPGRVVIGDRPNENEVTIRFAEALPDDQYRVEIFGFDDPVQGIVGLRGTSPTGAPGDLFMPTNSGTRKDTIDFQLDLGPRVTSVVPQPVVRNAAGNLEQLRDTVVVYFDGGKLLVDNDAVGNPTSQSAENPEFYQLIFTDDTVRNTDDLRFLPQSVTYNASANTATLRFGQDINNLPGSNAGPSTFRLRIGTRETAPLAPQASEAAATAISDFNTGGRAKIRFTSRELGESGSGISVVVVNSNSGNPPLITASGKTINVDLGSDSVTMGELLAALQNASASSDLVSVQFEPGSDPSVILNAPINYSPISVVGLGSSFNTATDLGVIGSAVTDQTSLILSSEINPVPFDFDLPGASNDLGHREVPSTAGESFEQHINELFGADKIDGVSTIMYNFQTVYGVDSSGSNLINAITEKQKDRAREALQIWANEVGVQFIETPDLGITIATGSFSALNGASPDVVTQGNISLGVQIDPEFEDSLLILEASRQWGDNYGEDWFRASLTGLGMLLGLERAGDLPSGTLMALSTGFINAGNSNATPADEPVFPGTFDVLHGQHVFRNDSNDIDLYKFEVDFDGQDRVGLFVAETIAERQTQSSPLDSLLHLYKQQQASAQSNLAAGASLSVQFDAIAPGRLGNNLEIFITKSARGAGAPVLINVFENSITVDLNSTVGSETTAQQLIDAINANAASASLVNVSLASGSGSTVVGNRDLTFSPIVLRGGDIELISRNDDYFSEDSLISQSLDSGVYYLGISSSGNDTYDPVISDTGIGGTTQGKYDLRVTFRAQVDAGDAIRDTDGGFVGDEAVIFDGDGDGTPGGTYNFWFQTRPLDRTLNFTAGGDSSLEGKLITLTGANGVSRRFEFDSNGSVGTGNTAISYTVSDAAGQLAQTLADAIRSRPELGINAVANGTRLVLQGERSIQLAANLNNIDIQGRTLFVDKSAGPNADGSLAKPFNSIAGSGVANAFAVAQPGDIVRIVGNGGGDNDISTIDDNLAYEIGFGLINSGALSDGSTMEVPKGVTTMIDAGAIFKMRRSRIGVGSSSLGVDRSGGALQVLGTPTLTDANGALLRAADGSTIPGSVYFTSWLDETIGQDTYAPQTTASVGDWGGISYRNDVDSAAGRRNLEDEGIFLQYVNHADIRFGGGGNVVIDSVQQVVNPIQMIDVRPSITFNQISNSADAAMSAAPNSFEETNFHEPRFQLNGSFTSDYDRVGPQIYSNTLTNNSLNGIFVRVETPAGQVVRPLTVPARFDDIDITHIVSENITIAGTPGGAILDTTRPLSNLVSATPITGGTLLPGTYNYKISLVDQFGYETPTSDASSNATLAPGQTAVSILGLPLASGDYVARRLYRSDSNGAGTYTLVAEIDAKSSGFTDLGQNAGGILERVRPDVSGVSLTVSDDTNGALDGTYNYRIVMVDSAGRESIASDPTANLTTSTNTSIISVSNIPPTQSEFAARRVYRSGADGSGPYVLVAELSNSSTSFVDDGSLVLDAAGDAQRLSPFTLGNLRPRLDASLVVDPGSVVKFEGARIEIEQGANLIAEGTDGAPVIFTSKLDDRFGAGGTFDTNNDASNTTPQPRDWGGIYASSGATLSLDYTTVAYAGGVTKIEGTFKAFNPIELQEANARITNSTFEFNEDGIGGQGPTNRLGRLDNRSATIFVRGTQPILVGNTFRSNEGSAINIDANSLNADLRVDIGRSTGSVDRLADYDSNRGPLIRENRMNDNELNGLEVRGDLLTVESVWDDTDIVHVLFNSITVTNFHHEGGLRLQSSPNESLVVKLLGYGSNFDYDAGTGFTATGFETNAEDRVGGTVEILGQPGFPVVLTSLHDDTVGAGVQPDGTPQTDTNNNGIGSIPRPSDWRSVLLDQNSNDRNVQTVLEIESPNAVAPGFNSTADTAQLLGDLAKNASSSDENLRLGFVVQGVLSEPTDVDVYSFTAEAGTEVWLDIDETTQSLDLVIELLNANGDLLARSDNSTAEFADPSLLVRTPAISSTLVNPLSQFSGNSLNNASGTIKEDGTINPRDAGMRVLLPGAAGSRTTFHFRIRSASTNPENFNAGLTSGSYEVQVRTRATQEIPGSTVQYADIRYATNGVHLRGLPTHSPLLGEFQEDEASVNGSFANNDVNFDSSSFAFGPAPGARSQYLGNLLETDRATISVGGQLSAVNDLDFYEFEVSYVDLIDNDQTNLTAPVVFDIDYADGLNRADTNLSVFRVTGSVANPVYQLVYHATDSNIADDQRGPLSLTDIADFSRGSVGPKDPFIGGAELPVGRYAVAVSAASRVPTSLNTAGVRREPLQSVARVISEDFTNNLSGVFTPAATATNLWHFANDRAQFASFAGGSITQPGGASGDLVSDTFDLGAYSSLDLPKLYIDYGFVTDGNDSFSVLIEDGSGAITPVATLAAGNTQRIVDLSAFVGQNNLKLIFRFDTNGTNTASTSASVDEVILGFAERGEQIFGASTLTTFSTVGVPANTIQTGAYQLEIRQGNSFSQPFDTNDRAAEQITLIAPAGDQLVDGDQFIVRDAGNEIVFEFTTDAAVTPGNVAISFTSTDPSNVIAGRIRDAINDPGVQSRLAVKAASRTGATSGPTGDSGINLFGRASGEFGKLDVIYHSGFADQNTNRDQGQVLVQNNFIRYSRDYGVWTEPGDRLQDPRDLLINIDPFMRFGNALSDRPALAGNSPGAVRNLRELNDSLIGGFNTGVVISNNVLESGGLGGVHVAGDSPIWMITPSAIPAIRAGDPNTGDASTGNSNNPFDHFGSFLDDSDLLVIDSGRTRVQFEFEDIAGAGTGAPSFGSGTVQGDGWDDQSVPIYYREDGGQQYLRLPNTTSGYTNLEVMQSIRDSILGSILVTNGTTQNVKATVSASLLGADLRGASLNSNPGYLNYYNRSALFLEGVSNINFVNRAGGGNPFQIQRVDVAETPQAFARVVNNTVYGNDGRASFNADIAVNEPNDTIPNAVETWQGTGHNPLSFTMDAEIGDSSILDSDISRDVDLYKFKLDIGERVLIDIDTDTAVSGLDSVVQIFDASGRPQQFLDAAGLTTTISDNRAAPGETLALDPYIDFTATAPGVYYAAVSASGNSSYDPLSFGGRSTTTTTGSYSIDLMVMHPQDFTITAEDASQYNAGDTFTIFQVADFADGTNSRTFEFTTGGAVQPGNTPINFNATYRAPDMARAIAEAINRGNNNGPVLPNTQQLANGDFSAASPLDPVSARPLGGLSAVEGGLQLFPRRPDGSFPTHSGLGIGHDRVASGQLSNTSLGDGTTERFVAIKNAAYIVGNGSIIVDPDVTDNNNLDQVLPESGILVTGGASPTLMNNVFVNVQTPIVGEETRVASTAPSFGNRTPRPFGSASVNGHQKPQEIIVGGSVYQYAEPAAASNRLGFGIETTPTNVPNTGLDFNFTIPNRADVFVDPQASQFLPAAGSRIIDSSLDSLEEREAFRTVKQAVGIAVSPVLAPSRDATGQLRVDDPSVAPPNGQGADVFKDRGALDRADFVGPSAEAVRPLDNDAANVDRDNAVSVIQLASGVYPEFRVQLVDGFETADPFPGIGIDDNTVIGPGGILRQPGAAVTLFENGRLLVEGIDYRFNYNTTTNELIFTPLAGVWKNDRVYEIALNNKDRFVAFAPAGDQVTDGDSFTITDVDGGIVNFEFDSGYRLQVPQGLSLDLPLAGGSAGGITDGDRFSIQIGSTTRTFEFDRNGNFLSGNTPIAFELGASQLEIRDAVVAAIQNSGIAVTAISQSNSRIFLGAEAGVRVNTTFSAINQPTTTLGLKIPDLGPRPGGITEGQTFTVSDGRRTVTFEYDLDGIVAAGNTAIPFGTAGTAQDLTVITRQALIDSPLSVNPQIIANDLIHIGLSPNGTVDVGTSRLTILGVSRTIADGQQFTVSNGVTSATFEFTRDATTGNGNIPISVATTDNQDQIGERVATAIETAGLGLTPNHVGDGNIAVGGTANDSIDVSLAPALSLFGTPGVRSNTRLQVFGALQLQVPTRGATDVLDGSTFSLSNGGVTQIFEFDNNFTGPSQPGNIVIRYSALSTADDIAFTMAGVINGAGLGINATLLGSGRVGLGRIQANQFNPLSSSLTSSRGVVTDGEIFTISNGITSVTFEFDNVDIGNGFSTANVPIRYSSTSTPETVAASMKAAIEDSVLNLSTTLLSDGTLELDATPQFTVTTTGSPNLVQTGVPGGANPISFIQDGSFTGTDVKLSMIEAINAALDTPLIAKDRGGSTLFIENVAFISSELDSYFLQGIADLAGNLLKPNRINNETEFTILMPGVSLDYGDAPDPFTTTLGRYPTQHINDGARHVIGSTALLGASVDAESDGQPTPLADGDFDDGVSFGTNYQIPALFNRNVFTSIDVTLNSTGYVDGWIDFNADGDWDDPGERILDSVRFTSDSLSQTFMVTVPANAPIPANLTTAFARFRSSSTGGLSPTGLAVDGEVEDYAVTIAPGTPPTAVDDNYTLDEDGLLITDDPDGTDSPNFVIDDGIAANDTDPNGGPLGVEQVTGPEHAQSFTLNSDGTFTYQPVANFFGIDTFTYRVNDGILNSNNIGTVTITVREVNDSPIARPDFITIDEDEVLDIDQSVLLANDSPGPDSTEDSQTLVITGVNPISEQGGSVSLIGGRVIYTPPSDYSGPDSFIYVTTDNGTTGGVSAPRSSSATVSITVLDKNDAPIPGPDSLSTDEDTSVQVSGAVLIANDSAGPNRPGEPGDESGQSVRFAGVLPQSSEGGTVTVDSNNLVTYTPPADFSGTDTFFYRVEDNGLSDGVFDPQSAIGTVTVEVRGVNDAPRILTPFGTVTMQEDEAARVISLSDIFTDPDIATDGDQLSFVVISNDSPLLVSPTISNGQLTLQLLADQNGTGEIVVEATDRDNQTVRDTLSLIVTPVNDAPRLAQGLPDQNVNEDAIIPGLSLSPTYFFDPDTILNGDNLSFAVVSNSNPLLVSPTISGNTLNMVLSSNQSGSSLITISATDSAGQTVSDQFTLIVNPVNDVPLTTADSYTVAQGTSLTTTDPRGLVGGPEDDGVLANDSDPEGSALTAILVSAPQFATQFSLSSNGTFTYQHNGSSRATDTFTYVASDGSGNSVETTVTIEIGTPPPPPHQNPVMALDVNADGFVSPIDALIIVNFINNNGSGTPVSNLPPPPPFRDVDGNNFITANDVLQVINFLNSRSGSGEGEFSPIEVGLNPEFEASLMIPEFNSSQFAGRDQDNRSIGVRMIDGEEGKIYGPQLVGSVTRVSSQAEDSIFDQFDIGDFNETDWVSEDPTKESDVPIDLALASLLSDQDENDNT